MNLFPPNAIQHNPAAQYFTNVPVFFNVIPISKISHLIKSKKISGIKEPQVELLFSLHSLHISSLIFCDHLCAIIMSFVEWMISCKSLPVDVMGLNGCHLVLVAYQAHSWEHNKLRIFCSKNSSSLLAACALVCIWLPPNWVNSLVPVHTAIALKVNGRTHR